MVLRRFAVPALGLVLLLCSTPVAVAQERPPATIWRFLGIPQGLHKIRDVTTNRHGLFPGLERKPPRRAIADPLNLLSTNPAIKKAAEIKMEEDLAPQKIKALKYLAEVGCGCYPGVKEALMAALDDCTERVRLEAARQITNAAQNHCEVCNKNCCCDEELTARLAEIVYELDDEGCFVEASERVRQAAAEALQACCEANRAPPGAVPVLPPPPPGETIPDVPPAIETIPDDLPPVPPEEPSARRRGTSPAAFAPPPLSAIEQRMEDEESITVVRLVPPGVEADDPGWLESSQVHHLPPAAAAGASAPPADRPLPKGLAKWFGANRRSQANHAPAQQTADRALTPYEANVLAHRGGPQARPPQQQPSPRAVAATLNGTRSVPATFQHEPSPRAVASTPKPETELPQPTVRQVPARQVPAGQVRLARLPTTVPPIKAVQEPVGHESSAPRKPARVAAQAPQPARSAPSTVELKLSAATRTSVRQKPAAAASQPALPVVTHVQLNAPGRDEVRLESPKPVELKFNELKLVDPKADSRQGVAPQVIVLRHLEDEPAEQEKDAVPAAQPTRPAPQVIMPILTESEPEAADTVIWIDD